MKKCRCGVEQGQVHKDGCDWEVCPLCGHQLMSCSCDIDMDYSKLIPYGSVRELAAKLIELPCDYPCDYIEKYYKKEMQEAIKKGFW